jgi:hypothetical protein
LVDGVQLCHRLSLPFRQSRDQPQVQVALRSPALDALGNLRAKRFDQREGSVGKLLGAEGLRQIVHCQSCGTEGVSELAFQLAFRAAGVEDLLALDGSDAILGVPRSHRPAEKLDPELLAALLLSYLMGLLFLRLEDAESASLRLSVEPGEGFAK